MRPMEHFKEIADWFRAKGSLKYAKGQEEHGGRLWRKNVIHMLGDEILDLPTYYYVLLHQHESAIAELKEGLDTREFPHLYMQRAYNILTVGNPEGTQEEEK